MAATKDPKSRLQEWARARLHQRSIYRLVGAVGPSRAARFDVEVLVDGRVVGSGSGSTKKGAEMRALEALAPLEAGRLAEAAVAAAGTAAGVLLRGIRTPLARLRTAY